LAKESPTTDDPGYKPEKGLPEKLSLLRYRLGRKAADEPGFRFYALYGLLFRRDVLETALKLVCENKGAPGVDGVSIQDVTACDEVREAFLAGLQRELHEKTYRASPVRRVYIDKASGGKRPLGIPTVKDRVAQMACLLILEPIFETDFHGCSYGFRPGRSAHDALDEIRSHLRSGFCAVYDADIQSYFDSIDHRKLLACMRRRVVDRSVLKLISGWLKAPVEVRTDKGGKVRTHPKSGTPQGGVISPLLANVYLHELDLRWHRPGGPRDRYNARLVRYADDFVVLARYIGDPILDFLTDLLEGKMGLKLHPDKSRVVNLGEPKTSLDFLGYRFRLDRDLHGRDSKYWHQCPSPKAEAVIKDRMRFLTRRSQTTRLPIVVERVSWALLHWGAYYSHGYPSRVFQRIDAHALRRLGRFLATRSQRRMRIPKGQTLYGWVTSMGLVRLGSSQTITKLRGHRLTTGKPDAGNLHVRFDEGGAPR
jgi:RNA-directed DNA polymerase